MVPWTWTAPAAMAASALATPRPQSSWVWMPSGMRSFAATSWQIVSTSDGRVPPLVSHSTGDVGPALLGGQQGAERVLGVVLEAVEEMFGVVNDLAAVRL